MEAQCPKCLTIFDAKRSTLGAQYAKAWRNLTKQTYELTSWWLSHYPTKAINKETVVAESNIVSNDSVNARVSELVGCEILNKINNNSYQLNLTFATQVLNRGGKLI